MSDDPIMETIDDIFENGDEIPQRVSNRMLMAGIAKNHKNIDRVMQMFTGDPEEPKKPGVFERLNVLERFKEGIGKFIWLAVAAFLASIIGVVVQLASNAR